MRVCRVRGCDETIGVEHSACPDHRGGRFPLSAPANDKLDRMLANVSETHDYDPRHDRAQSVDGAKARYVTDDLPEYDEDALERDLERLMTGGENPDRRERPTIETQEAVLG